MPQIVEVKFEPGDGEAELSEAVVLDSDHLRVGDIEADLDLRAELVGEGTGDVLIGGDTLAEDDDCASAGVFAAAGAWGYLPAQSAVQAGAGADLAGEDAE